MVGPGPETAGAARNGPTGPTATAIRAAVEEILAEPAYRLAARRIASVIRGYEG